MQQSNGYIIGFSAALTIVLGGLLALAATGLKPAQKKQEELDTKRQILGAIMKLEPGDDALAIYDKRIESLVVNIDGMELETGEDGGNIQAETIEIGKEFKKNAEDRYYPIFKFLSEDGNSVEAYILPVFGNGLWDRIWGYVAVDGSFTMVKGVSLDHKAETPGLGARITDAKVQARFQDKKIYNDVGELVSVQMVKGETGNPSLYDDYHVDGLSGATMTANGVNEMLRNYLGYYEKYFKRLAKQDNVTSQVIQY